ncbi:MAG: hypothetical protein R6U57_08095 [Anaerolineales bacterium]
MKNWLRGFVAAFYLLGWPLHVYFGLFDPAIYEGFGYTALIPGFNLFWQEFVMPRITLLALLLAVFQISVGLLLIYRKNWVKAGLVLSLIFHLFLTLLGLSFPALNVLSDLYYNRCPNLTFFLIQIYLLFQDYPEPLLKSFRGS